MAKQFGSGNLTVERMTVGAGNPIAGATLTVNAVAGAGNSAINSKGVLAVTGNTGISASYGSTIGIVSNDTSSTSRLFFGDGSGWSFALSKRVGSATTDLFKISDSGGAIITVGTGPTALSVTSTGTSVAALFWTDSNTPQGIGGIYTAAGNTFIGTQNGTTLNFQTANTTRITIGTSGATSIFAPISGVALTVAGVSGYQTLAVNATGTSFGMSVQGAGASQLYLNNAAYGVGNAAIRIDSSATTGTGTATFTATNKPGGNTSPTQWLPISIGGTVYYIPLWL
jgi:hypothetical protein